jgi:phage head maturation protease
MTLHRPLQRATPKVGVPQLRVAYIEREPGLSDGPRRVRYVASDESVDRYGDIIRASGWQLDNFRKNPVLLAQHNTNTLPIGKVDPVGIEGTRLIAHAEFAPEGTSTLADAVWALVDKGYMNAASVGFMPLADPNPIRGEPDPKTGYQPITGWEFIAQELLELSVVSVPANPNALQLAKSFPLKPEELRCLFDSAPAAEIEAAHRHHMITLARLGRHRAAPTV